MFLGSRIGGMLSAPIALLIVSRWGWRTSFVIFGAVGGVWAVSIDIAPDHAGVITGCMHTLGNLGGLIGPLVVGIAVDRWGSWTFPFHVTAIIYACGALAWLAIDPLRPIGPLRQHLAEGG
jgi:nitrate/nitrite transporter NarK